MKKELHPANERGQAHHDWLDTYSNFSFAAYFNPVREQFGALRVLNEDTIRGGAGFEEHSHQNMEIITIPLSGTLAIKDSMGTTVTLDPGDVHVISSGTGIRHSECNHSLSEPVSYLQLWIYSRTRNQLPSSGKATFDPAHWKDSFLLLAGPDSYPGRQSLKISQQAWISRTRLIVHKEADYRLFDETNRVFIFIIEGNVSIEGESLQSRDAIGIWESASVKIRAREEAEFLFIEVPSR